MKRRFRKVVKEGWHVVRLSRANLWNWSQKHQPDTNIWGDDVHYRHIREWCNKTYSKDSWEGRLLQNNWWRDSSGSVITKEFAFKNEKDKTMFMLKWL